MQNYCFCYKTTPKRTEKPVTTNISGSGKVFGSLTRYLGYIIFLVHCQARMEELSIRERFPSRELFSFYLHNRWEDDLDQAEELNVY